MINYPYIRLSLYVLPAVSKTAERVIFDQLYEFSLNFLRDKILLKGHSCATALLKTCEDITTSLNSKEHTVAVTIDLSRAFKMISLRHIT